MLTRANVGQTPAGQVVRAVAVGSSSTITLDGLVARYLDDMTRAGYPLDASCGELRSNAEPQRTQLATRRAYGMLGQNWVFVAALDGREADATRLRMPLSGPIFASVFRALPAANGRRNPSNESQPLDALIAGVRDTREFLNRFAQALSSALIARCQLPAYVAPAIQMNRVLRYQPRLGGEVATASVAQTEDDPARRVRRSNETKESNMTSGMTTGAARAKIGLKQLPAPKSAGQAVGAKTGASDLGVQRVVIGTDAGCLIPTGRFREVPDQPAGRARAAGQATEMIITPEEVAAYNEAYVTAKNNANPAVQGMSEQRFASLMSTVGSALNTTGSTIAAIISSNNQLEIERLRQNTALRIAELNRGTQTATTTQQSTDLSTLLAILNAQNNQSQPWTKIAAGVAAVAVIGLGAYAIQRSTRRKNPVMTRGKTRKFVKPADVLDEMHRGFRVTGKTSSGKRRKGRK